ncbi:flagellar basal-body rod protein FlgF [Geobacter pickeringii]|uniref:Flagellar hook protein FlgE n=1 Tax=Geobacter pickeringii TaxID=345632 RepID=A0A0B5BIQ7_9BACT|nr:flagellar basal-body rod protein FlgF [Geobacter pickeringii]AJE04345.1 flagellar hook protein FlgE [Geobacter pickeringii]
MSVTSAMYTGISGLAANGEAMSVIGNNISNVNTTGFKSGRMLFSDVLSSTISGGSQIGRGVQIQAVQNDFSQGSFESTQSSTDLAIQGDSFFVVQNSNGRYYTRAGAFNFDKDKVLVNPDGYQVQGYGIIPGTGQSNGVLGAINLTSFASTPPKQTANVKMVVNLDSTQTTPALPWDPTNPVATSNFSTSLSVYDSLGNAHTATAYFRKTAANAWDWHVIIPDATAGTPGSVTTPINGTLAFSSTGALTAQTPTAGTAQNITFANGSTVPQPVLFDLGVGATTQYASASIVSSQTQDGYYQGTLTKVTIDDKGYVNGVYSNGQLQKLYQVALAKFSSNDGLSKSGGSLFEETLASGQPMLSNAATPGVGKILSNSLEQSNVDMAAQFVKMITTQRGYSANSKTITTADEMLQEVLGLKR